MVQGSFDYTQGAICFCCGDFFLEWVWVARYLVPGPADRLFVEDKCRCISGLSIRLELLAGSDVSCLLVAGFLVADAIIEFATV